MTVSLICWLIVGVLLYYVIGYGFARVLEAEHKFVCATCWPIIFIVLLIVIAEEWIDNFKQWKQHRKTIN